MLANSGAEALENAVKIARYATGREAVVVFEHAFHGRTLLTMSMTSKVRPYKFGFGPFAPEIYRLPYPYAYRGHYTGAADAARELEEFFQTQVAAEKVACVVVELVAGEGGFMVAPREWVDAPRPVLPRPRHPPRRRRGPDRLRPDGPHVRLRALRTRAGRDHDGQVPRRGPSPLGHHGPRGGHGQPRTSAASAEPTPAIRSPAPRRSRPSSTSSASVFPSAPARIGEEVERRFQCFVERFPFVGDARGLGAMRALELVRDRGTKEPDKDRTDRVIRKACETGLLLVGAGTYGNVIRTLMPLVVTDAELTEGLDVLEKALESA